MTRRIARRGAALLASFFVAAVCFAADAEAVDATLSFEVSAPREEEEKTAAASADFSVVLDREELSGAAQSTVAAALETVPGVQVLNHGGPGQGAYVSIRGSSPEQVLVLVDGRRLNPAQGGGADLAGIDLEAVEGVEVVRGAAASRYGGGALAGVVDFRTRRASRPEDGGSAFLQYGSWNSVRAGASLEGGLASGAADGYASAAVSYSSGAYPFADPGSAESSAVMSNADFRAADLFLRLDAYPSDDSVATATLAARAAEKGAPGIPEFPAAEARMEDARAAFALSFENGGGGPASFRSAASADLRRRRYRDPAYFLGPVDDSHASLAAAASADFRLALPRPLPEGAALASSADFSFDALDSTAYSRGPEGGSGRAARWRAAAAARAELPFLRDAEGEPAFLLVPGARIDFALDAADAASLPAVDATWQLSAALRPLPSVALKANAGTAFRAPSFDDLFWPAGAFAEGNPDLLPERSFAWDLGLAVSPFRELSLEAAYFDRAVRDLIVWNPGPGGKWRPSNLSEARIRGVEFRGGLLLPRLAAGLDGALRAGASWMDPRDATPGSASEGLVLPGKACVLASGSFDLRSGPGRFVRAEASYLGPRFVTARNTKSLDGAVVFGLAAGWTFAGFRLAARLDNLLDARYVDLRDHPVPGREFSVRIDYAF